MDPQRFDDLARVLGAGATRRSVLKGLVAVGITALFRPAWRGKAASAEVIYSCSSTTNISVPCDEISAYLNQCGTICPDGFRKQDPNRNIAGCTNYNIMSWPRPDIVRVEPAYDHAAKAWCASAKANWLWWANPQTSVTHWQPSTPACCQLACEAAIEKWTNEIQKHEDGHVEIINNLVLVASASWKDLLFKECGKNKKQAYAARETAIGTAIDSTLKYVAEEQLREPAATIEALDCPKCVADLAGGSCIQDASGGGVTCQCPSGYTVCNSSCVDTQTSSQNCGSCNQRCPTGQPCVNGICGCKDFQTNCQVNEICQNGACVAVCLPAGGGGVHSGTFYACAGPTGSWVGGTCGCNGCPGCVYGGVNGANACCSCGCIGVVTRCDDTPGCG